MLCLLAAIAAQVYFGARGRDAGHSSSAPISGGPMAGFPSAMRAASANALPTGINSRSLRSLGVKKPTRQFVLNFITVRWPSLTLLAISTSLFHSLASSSFISVLFHEGLKVARLPVR